MKVRHSYTFALGAAGGFPSLSNDYHFQWVSWVQQAGDSRCGRTVLPGEASNGQASTRPEVYGSSREQSHSGQQKGDICPSGRTCKAWLTCDTLSNCTLRLDSHDLLWRFS